MNLPTDFGAWDDPDLSPEALNRRLEEAESEIERMSDLLFKFAKMFAEELNI